MYKKRAEKYNNQTLSNIFVKLNESTSEKAKNILLCAHYDSDKNSYGAGDDGLCVASLLETIRCMRNKDFNNNIYVLFTDGEEQNFLGAFSFVKSNNIDFDAVLNFDNCGNSGNIKLYSYSNSKLANQYIKSSKNEVCYSFVSELIFNTGRKNTFSYSLSEPSDNNIFYGEGYNALDFAMIGTPFYYHSEGDNFYNIDIKSLEKLTTSIIDMVEYFGNNDFDIDNDKDLFFFEIANGIEIVTSKNVYYTISILSILITIVYIIVLFRKKEKRYKKIIVIMMNLLAIISLIILKNFSLFFTIPCIILFISNFIKNTNIKFVFRVAIFEIYWFIILQLIAVLGNFAIWLYIFSK